MANLSSCNIILYHYYSTCEMVEAGASCPHYFGGGTSWGGGAQHNTAATTAHMFYFFLFIQNIPKRINYIMKYLDSHTCIDYVNI